MSASASSQRAIGRFVVRCLLWLAPSFALWALASPVWARPAAWLAEALLRVTYPVLAWGFEITGSSVTFITDVIVPTAYGSSGMLTPEVDTRVYTHGLALFLALMLASGARWTRIAAGAIALLPVHAWGIAFGAVIQVVGAGPGIGARAGITGAQVEMIALAYQAGSILLPVLAPVALWVALDFRFLAALGIRAHIAAAPPAGEVAGG